MNTLRVLTKDFDEDDEDLELLTPTKGTSLLWTPRVELVEGLVVQRARPTSLYALPGVGKGNVAIYVLLSVQHALPVLGFSTKPVDWYAYVDGEDDEAEFSRRAIRIAKGLDVKIDDRLNYVEIPYKLNTKARRARLTELLAKWSQQGEGLVVYDSGAVRR